ncbi:hypothetical protein BC629DRAFT_1447377 [Irpex lacteus]|nr:hypothetical protein BC629DRAFT_1447377 [Irpex lacteus]
MLNRTLVQTTFANGENQQTREPMGRSMFLVYRVLISRRPYSLKGLDRGLIIMAAVPVMHEMKAAFFYLLQHEGDPYKVTIEHGERDIRALKIRYFDTVHIVLSLCILKSGFLFIAAEFGNHPFYKFQRLGDDDSDNETRILLDVLSSLGTADPTPPFPHPFDSAFTLSFVNGALVLSIGELSKKKSKTLASSPHYGTSPSNELAPPPFVNKWRISQAQTSVTATNKRHVVVVSSSAELVYFELDLDGQRDEYPDRTAMGTAHPLLGAEYEDQSVRIISVDPENTLGSIRLQALAAPPSAICIADMPDAAINQISSTTLSKLDCKQVSFYGLCSILSMDSPRIPGLSSLECALSISFESLYNEIWISLRLSSRSWLAHTYQNLLHFTPLKLENLDYAWRFSAELCLEGSIGISEEYQDMEARHEARQQYPFLHSPQNDHTLCQQLYLIEGGHRVLAEIQQRGTERSKGEQGSSTFLLIYLEEQRLPLVTWPQVSEALGLTVNLIPLDNNKAALWFATETNDVPLAVLGFQDCLVAGVSNALELYDMGKKKLLRKTFSSAIVTLATQGPYLPRSPPPFPATCAWLSAPFAQQPVHIPEEIRPPHEYRYTTLNVKYEDVTQDLIVEHGGVENVPVIDLA